MSKYEMFLIGGSSMAVFAVLLLFSAGAHDQPLRKSMAFSLLAAGLLYMADRYSPGGINPGDIPGTFIKFVRMFF
ncbi:MAG: hypothetical protein COA53_04800 [Rhodobacteraceae bacterium]|nr:MAG: hypothetical protein COA53_04800 [Paracoccaceae bacterium]